MRDSTPATILQGHEYALTFLLTQQVTPAGRPRAAAAGRGSLAGIRHLPRGTSGYKPGAPRMFAALVSELCWLALALALARAPPPRPRGKGDPWGLGALRRAQPQRRGGGLWGVVSNISWLPQYPAAAPTARRGEARAAELWAPFRGGGECPPGVSW